MLNEKEELFKYLVENIEELEDFITRIKLDYEDPLGVDVEDRDLLILQTVSEKTRNIIGKE